MEIKNEVGQILESVEKLKSGIAKVIVGQDQLVELLITALLCDGHVLIEGVPGVAKTLVSKLMANCISADFKRLQFTPDLMPSDVTGTSIFNPQTASFNFKKGPVFSNIVLIDEINRAPAKTQAALFEVMEERQVTIDGITHPVPLPFMVIATQNPVEHEGTYRLPEAQLDRFLFKIEVGYPSYEEEVKILQLADQGVLNNISVEAQPVVSKEEILAFREVVNKIYIEEKVLRFIASLVYETRNNRSLFLGASPRASVAVLKAAKAFAVINGRDYVTPDDVQRVIYPVLCHRIILTPEREMEGGNPKEVISELIKKTEVPR